MGDRGNIAILNGRGQVWFYTHWNGSEIEESVRKALALKERWTDAPYLTRIIWDNLVSSDRHGETTGFGISTAIGDNEHPILVVDIPKQRVFFIDEPQLKDGGTVPNNYNPPSPQTFAEFIAHEPALSSQS